MTRTIHPEATQELRDAFKYYKGKGDVTLARDFLDEIHRVATMLEHNPGFGSIVSGTKRRFLLKRFPYTLVYIPIKDGIRVLAVVHQKRKPDYWLGRQ